MKNLRLQRPLLFFDLETTGIDPSSDRIVQIGLVRVEPEGGRKTFESLVNPLMPIPPGAIAVHGISDADVADKPPFRELLPEILPFFDRADLAGFNSIGFDLPLLLTEVERSGGSLDLTGRRHLDAMAIFHKMEPRNLAGAVRFYCGKELEGAHGALVDASATLEVLDAQLARYENLPDDLDRLHTFCNPDEGRWVDITRKLAWNDSGLAVFSFGKHRGKTLQAVASKSPDYLEWVLGSDFSPEVKRIVSDALAGRFPRKKNEGELF